LDWYKQHLGKMNSQQMGCWEVTWDVDDKTGS
jgi:hypothetical protein